MSGMSIRPLSQLHFYGAPARPRRAKPRRGKRHLPEEVRQANAHLESLNDRDHALFVRRLYEGDPIPDNLP